MKNNIAIIVALLMAAVVLLPVFGKKDAPRGVELTRGEVLAVLNRYFDESGMYFRAVGVSWGELRLEWTGSWQPEHALFCMMAKGGQMRRAYELASLSSVSFDGRKVDMVALKDSRDGRYHACKIPQ